MVHVLAGSGRQRKRRGIGNGRNRDRGGGVVAAAVAVCHAVTEAVRAAVIQIRRVDDIRPIGGDRRGSVVGIGDGGHPEVGNPVGIRVVRKDVVDDRRVFGSVKAVVDRVRCGRCCFDDLRRSAVALEPNTEIDERKQVEGQRLIRGKLVDETTSWP